MGKTRQAGTMPLLAAGLGGLMVGLVAVSAAGSAVSYVWVKKTEVDARRGWNLVPVVVAARDLPAGEVVTHEALSQRSIPEQLVTASVVKPAGASAVVNQRLAVGVSKGAPLRYAAFASDESVNPARDAEALEACWRELTDRGLWKPAKGKP